MAVIFQPTESLASNASCTVSIVGPVLDRDGVAAAAPAALTVRTAKGPGIVRYRPFAGSSDASRTASLSVRFTARMDRASTEAAFSARIGSRKLNGTSSWAERDTVLVFKPSAVSRTVPRWSWPSHRRRPIEAACRSRRPSQGLIRAEDRIGAHSYFSGTKLEWLLDRPGRGARARRTRRARLGTIDTWLLWQLTGGACHATDVTNASRTLLYNIHDGRWDDELLGELRLPGRPAARGAARAAGRPHAR